MADNVAISTGTAATIAAEDVAGVEYQRIKIVDGGAAGTLGVVATSAAPAAGTVGLVVRVAGSVAIAPTTLTVNTGPTTLTVNTATEGASRNIGSLASVAATAGTSPAAGSIGLVVALKAGAVVTVNTAPTVAGASVTIQQGASVVASISGVTPTAGTPTAAMTGVPVWIVGGQTAAGGVTVLIAGTVTVQSVIAIASVGSISVVGTIGTVNSISTVGTVLGTVNALDATHTQFILQVSSTSPSNNGMLLFTAYVGSGQAANTAGVSLFAIPAGKQLRIVNIQVVAAGSVSALFGAVQVIFATSAASVTVSAIGGRGPAVAIAGATTVFQAFQANAWNDIPATQTVGVGITLNTSCLLGGVQVVGYLFP